MAGNALQEYVIALGAKIDNAGVTQVLSLLDSSKLKALGLTAAIGAATTAIYKFVEATTKKEFEMAKLAKQQKKNLELVKAEQMALNSMGKTLQEIKKDDNLKKIYDDLVKFNKELQMPDMTAAMGKIRNLQGAFWKLKDVVEVSMQWIGAKVLKNLEAPIDRITEKINKGSNWLRDNMGRFTSKIALFMSDFGKGVIGIAEGIGKIFERIQQLPDEIKSVGGAIGTVFALIKGGPIGQILSLITAVGDVMHDYDNWKANRDAGLRPGDEGYVATALGPIWEIKDSDLPADEKWSKIGSLMLGKITNALKNATKDWDMSEIFGDGGEENPGLIGAITRWLKDEENKTALQNFGNALVDWICTSVKNFGGVAGGAAGKIIDAIFGSGTTDQKIYTDEGSAGLTLAGSLGGFFKGFFEKLGEKGSKPFDAFKQGIGEGVIGAALGSLIGGLSEDEEGNGITLDFGKITVNLEATARTFLNLISTAVSGLSDIGGEILDTISTAIGGLQINSPSAESFNKFTSTLGDVFKKWSGDKTLVSGLSTSLITLITGGNIFESVLTGVFASFTQSRKKAMIDALENAPEGRERGFLESLTDAALEKEYEEYRKSHPEYKMDIWGGIFQNFGDTASNLITGLWDALLTAASGAANLGGTLMTTLLNTILGIISNDGLQFTGTEDNAILGAIGVSIGTKMAGGGFLTSLATGLLSGISNIQSRAVNGKKFLDVLKEDAEELWIQIEDIWYGPIENGTRNRDKGLASALETLWGGEDGDGGLKGFFDKIAAQIGSWLQPIGDAIVDFFNGIWIRIYNEGPQWLRQALGFAGIEDPNKSTITANGDGTYTVESTNGRKTIINATEERRLRGHEDELTIDSNGEIVWSGAASSRGTKPLDALKQYEENQAKRDWFYLNPEKDLNDMLNLISDKYKGDKEKWIEDTQAAMEEKLSGIEEEQNLAPGSHVYKRGSKYYGLYYDENGNIDWSQGVYTLDKEGWLKRPDSVVEEIKEEFEDEDDRKRYTLIPDVDMQQAQKDINTFFEKNKNYIIEVSANVSGEEVEGHKALGARVTRRGLYELAEDGDAEYVIPTNNPGRAFSLVNQLLSEMGGSFVDRVMESFGFGSMSIPGTIGASMNPNVGSMGDILGNLRMSSNYNVSAPVTIYVNATGSNGKDIGEGAYSAAERHLVRTLRGVYA